MTMSDLFAFPGPSKVEKKKNEYNRDLNLLSIPELLELLERQNKLIQSSALKKLADKGQKVILRKQQIEDELGRRSKSVDLCDELTKLSIQEKNVDVLEWGVKDINIAKKTASNEGDNLFDEKDPLTILATHSGTAHNKRKVKIEDLDEALITLEDIEDVYAFNLCTKIDKAVTKEKFLPHKTLHLTKVATKCRDLSAATPPLPVYGDAKLISLQQSLELQFEQTRHLKEVQLRHATERLRDFSGFQMGSIVPKEGSIKTYRVPTEVYNEEEADEENDEEE